LLISANDGAHTTVAIDRGRGVTSSCGADDDAVAGADANADGAADADAVASGAGVDTVAAAPPHDAIATTIDRRLIATT
jgi:hypothetical protein